MKDIIWTVIIVWFIYKIVDIFKNASTRKFSGSGADNKTQTMNAERPDNSRLKSVLHKRMNKEGEYVDFEETK
jgi:hypothetical protein